jgi:rare lipoprotein A
MPCRLNLDENKTNKFEPKRTDMKQIILALSGLAFLSACASAAPMRTGTSTAPAKAYVKVGSPYKVKGVTYRPAHQPNYNVVGMASWYGPGFHGRSTANGETYNKWAFTAAHPTLPLPSLVRVMHLKSGKQVVVRINDRGPFANNRIIDLSRAAAEELGMLRQGVAKVRVQFLKAETAQLMRLVNSGKRPFNIDIEREVIRPVQLARGGKAPATRRYASARTRVHTNAVAQPRRQKTLWNRMSVVSHAQAAEAPKTQSIKSSNLPALGTPQRAAPGANSIYNVLPKTTAPKAAISVKDPVKIVTPARAKSVQIPAVVSPQYSVKLATFSSQQRAETLRDNLAGKPVVIDEIQTQGRTLYRTSAGPFSSKAEADRMVARAYGLGLKDAYIVNAN